MHVDHVTTMPAFFFAVLSVRVYLGKQFKVHATGGSLMGRLVRTLPPLEFATFLVLQVEHKVWWKIIDIGQA